MKLPWKNPKEFIKAAEKLPFKDSQIERPPVEEHLIDLFCTEEKWIENAEINLDSVVGSVHPDYQGHSWMWLLKHGKRMRGNLELLFSNPGYYFSGEKKLPTMSYLLIDGKKYVYHDGNHRTCIAKFLFHLLERKPSFEGVEVYCKKLNTKAYQAWQALGGPQGMVLVRREKLIREDGPGWKKELFCLNFTVFQGKRVYKNLSSEELVAFLSEKQKKPLFRRVLDGVRFWRKQP